MKLNFEQKAVTSTINRKVKTIAKQGGNDPKESQQANSKMGDFGKKKIQKFFGKINAYKGKKKKEGTQQTNRKQGTEFSAIYPN